MEINQNFTKCIISGCEDDLINTIRMRCRLHFICICIDHHAYYNQQIRELQNNCIFCEAEQKAQEKLNRTNITQQEIKKIKNINIIESIHNYLTIGTKTVGKGITASKSQILKQISRELTPTLLNRVKNSNFATDSIRCSFQESLQNFYKFSDSASKQINIQNAGKASFKSFFSKIGLGIQAGFFFIDLCRDFYHFFKDPNSDWKTLIQNILRSFAKNCVNLVGCATGSCIGSAIGILLGPIGAFVGGIIGAISGGIAVEQALQRSKCLQFMKKSYQRQDLINEVKKSYKNMKIEYRPSNITVKEFEDKRIQILSSDFPGPNLTDEQKDDRTQSLVRHMTQFSIIKANQDAFDFWKPAA